MYAAYRLSKSATVFHLKTLSVFLMLATGLMSVSTAGYANSFGEADIAAVRSVINSQIEAFNSDDAEVAYEFSSPKIKALFPTPEAFMAMVRRGYEPVYRAENYSFEEVAIIDGQIIQPIRIIADSSVAPIIAMYIMEQQPDETCKICGCILLKESGQSV